MEDNNGKMGATNRGSQKRKRNAESKKKTMGSGNFDMKRNSKKTSIKKEKNDNSIKNTRKTTKGINTVSKSKKKSDSNLTTKKSAKGQSMLNKNNTGNTSEHKRNSNRRKITSNNSLNRGVEKYKLIDIEALREEQKKKKIPVEKHALRVIPLGGLNEIGKNITALEYEDDIMLIDCGLTFPDDELFGIDIVLPDFTFLIENQHKIKGIILTHGHEDHIGAIPYLLKKINIPVYGTRLPIGLVRNKLKEHGITSPRLINIKTGDKIPLGNNFVVEAIRTTHSIADSICLAIDTPVGTVFHTGDFKIDYTPIDGEPIDLSKLAEIGSRGVTLMMSDSTNATRPGSTASESKVGQSLENIFRGAGDSRIIVSTFSSNVHRIQKIVDNALNFGRKVTFAGRSMVNVVDLALELGYLNIPKSSMVDINKTNNIPDKNLVIITTGSQGEPLSALTRMANNEHRAIKIKVGDMVILSSTPVPGNERMVSNVINRLICKGAQVIYNDIAETHVSGHACQDELKLIHALIKPKYFMPVHGEFRHLKASADLAMDLGMDPKKIFFLSNGDALQINHKRVAIKYDYAVAGDVYVDGLGVGDVGSSVIKDRKILSESGLIVVSATIDKDAGIIVAGPELLSRGFVYVRENEDLIGEAKKVVEKSLERVFLNGSVRDWNATKNLVREDLRKFIIKKTKRNPMILPIFMEV